MRRWIAAHPFLTSNLVRAGLSAAITGLFAALSLLLYPRVTREPTILAIVPAGVAGMLTGLWGGLAAGAAAWAVNGVILYQAGERAPITLIFGPGAAEAIVGMVAGIAVGWLRDTQAELSRRAGEYQRAQQETAEQRALSEALRDTLSEMVATFNLDRVLNLILNNVWRVVPHDAANIMLIDHDDDAHIAAWRGYTSPDIMLALTIRFDVRSLANLRAMLETGRGIAIGDVHQDPEWVHYEHGHWIHSYIGAPIRIEGKVLGFLNLDSAMPGLFTEADLARLQAFADEAAIAIHNARLYDQVARHAEQLEQRVAERTAELSAAKDRLEELDRLKSKFVADVSHELRTPVANLSLYVDLLQNGPHERHDEYVTVVGQQVGRLSALVESILNLTRLELGRGRTDHTPVDLNLIAREVITSFEPRAEAAGLKMVFQPGEKLPQIAGEASQLGQVIGNLLANAIQYTRAGEVCLSTGLSPGRDLAVLTVTDTGSGISPEDMPHLFERFYRGRDVAESATPGTGLGLSIVKEIVELHNGSVSVRSEPGNGSTFTVRLPLGKTPGE